MLRESASPLRSGAALLQEPAPATMASTCWPVTGSAPPSPPIAPVARWLGGGVHGLSNHLLDTPWPKLLRSKARLVEWLSADEPPIEDAFALLADREPASDDALPATGVSPQWERLLSSPFIVSSDYGTRSSTLLLIARDDSARLIERSFDADAQLTGEVAFDFRTGAPALA